VVLKRAAIAAERMMGVEMVSVRINEDMLLPFEFSEM
jgi:hypothetical protein